MLSDLRAGDWRLRFKFGRVEQGGRLAVTTKIIVRGKNVQTSGHAYVIRVPVTGDQEIRPPW